MLSFITDNLATLLIGAALLCVVGLIIRNMLTKAVKGQCVSCDGCDGAGCHHHAADERQKDPVSEPRA